MSNSTNPVLTFPRIKCLLFLAGKRKKKAKPTVTSMDEKEYERCLSIVPQILNK